MSTAIVYDTPKLRADRLRELGVSEETLRQAVNDGFAARRNCTLNHPPQAAGWYTWSETTRSLRERLVLMKWTTVEQGGLSLIVNPSKTIAIAVTTGDNDTGLADGMPRSKNTKGAAALVAVANNQTDFGPIILGPPAIPPPVPEPTPWRTYYLLVAMVDGEGRCELSLPESIGDDQRFDEWIERIPLTPLSWNEPEPTPETTQDMPDLDIPVTRITNASV